MILEHYASEPLAWPLRDVPQRPYDQDGNGKPRGFWVSVKGDDDWPSWCEAEGFRPDCLSHCHRVHLADDHNVRIISGEKQLIAFDREFGADWMISPQKTEWHPNGFSLRRIDWQNVAKEYDGVIIAPYVWSCRLGGWVNGGKDTKARVSDWYYGWDCASGCIWNAKAIASIEEVRGG